MRFEKISKYSDTDIVMPVRKTSGSAGYDFVVSEDTIIPAYNKSHYILNLASKSQKTMTLAEMADLTSQTKIRPTLVPTGIKCYLDEGYYLELSVRSSCPLKHWLILANGVGIIDSDYVDNPDNEGHIFFQIINLSPFDIQLQKGDIIGQGIIKQYHTTENDVAVGVREGGFGSTSTNETEDIEFEEDVNV